MRIGYGYDVHRLVPGRRLVLGGVVLASPLGLDGHSDADIVCHAVTDAVLGAAGIGDIGRLFPDTDPQWKGADSRAFLRHCDHLIRNQGWMTGNVDITVICEQPKVGPHAEAMRGLIALDLGIELDAVSMKATTTETLGFTGRGEGIAAQAVCLLIRA